MAHSLRVGAIAVAIVGAMGLRTWKQQMRGTRSQTLAEESLSLMYRVVDAIGHTRQPHVLGGEMKLVERREDENEEDFEHRKDYEIIEVRYQQHAEVASQLAAIRFRVHAALGKEVQEAIDDVLSVLRRVRSEASTAAGLRKMLTDNARLLDEQPSQARANTYEVTRLRLDEAEDYLWALDPETDKAGIQLAAAVQKTESALGALATVVNART